LTDEVRDLIFSRMMRRPMDIMQYKVDQLLHGSANSTSDPSDPIDVSKDKIKYMIYSAHDDQIDNMMVWLNATNIDFYTILFASQVQFELTYDVDCIASLSTEMCFSVKIIFNGHELAFNGNQQTQLSYPEFKAYMAGIWYSGKDSTDLNLACNQTYTPHYPEFMFHSGNYAGFL